LTVKMRIIFGRLCPSSETLNRELETATPVPLNYKSYTLTPER